MKGLELARAYYKEYGEPMLREKFPELLPLLAAGLAVNLFFSRLAISLDLPLYLDNIGTILAAVLGGYVPGAAVGYLTNLINGLQEAETLFYG